MGRGRVAVSEREGRGRVVVSAREREWVEEEWLSERGGVGRGRVAVSERGEWVEEEWLC